jgi:hypothetical protein
MPSVTELDDHFDKNTTKLKEVSQAAAEALQNVNLRQWFIGDPDLWSENGYQGDPLDIVQMSENFDRTDVGNDYVNTFGDENSSTGDQVALKKESDWLAALERAFRSRHASPVRCAIHAAGRRLGHGDDAGVWARVKNQIIDIAKAGSDGFIGPGG